MAIFFKYAPIIPITDISNTAYNLLYFCADKFVLHIDITAINDHTRMAIMNSLVVRIFWLTGKGFCSL